MKGSRCFSGASPCAGLASCRPSRRCILAGVVGLRYNQGVRGAPGRIQFTSILTLLLISVGGYFAYALTPAYVDNYTLKQDLSGIANQAWHRMGKEELQKQVIEKAS